MSAEVKKWQEYRDRLEVVGKKFSAEYEDVVGRLSRAWQLDGLCYGCGGPTFRAKGKARLRKWCCTPCSGDYNGARKSAKERMARQQIPEDERESRKRRSAQAMAIQVKQANIEIGNYFAWEKRAWAARKHDANCAKCERPGAVLTMTGDHLCRICRSP